MSDTGWKSPGTVVDVNPIIDSYSESNSSSTVVLGNSGGNKYVAREFVNTSISKLSSVVFFLGNGYQMSPTGNIYAKIYAVSSHLPSGSALATSDAVSVSSLPSLGSDGNTKQLITFTFSGTNAIQLNASTTYMVALDYSGGDGTNYICYGARYTANSSSGIYSAFSTDGSSWTSSQLWEICFYVYSDAPGTVAWTNPSNAKASDNSYADVEVNFGANSIEEYSIKLVKSGTVSGDEKSTSAELPYSEEYIDYGGTADKWGLSLSSSDINNSDFGVVFSVKGFAQGTISHYLKATNFGFSLPTGATVNGILVEIEELNDSTMYNTAYVDHIQIKVYYTEGTPANSERNLYSKGKTTGSSERNLYSRGKLTNSSERLIRSIGGGIVSSERGIYTTSGAGESQRGIYSYGKPNPVAIPFYQGKNEKKYSVKIYDRAGTTFKGNYDPIGGYAFTKTINGGVGALSITLPRKFDNFGLGEDVNLLDEIQVWVQDKDTSGKRIYSGYVSSITSFIDGSNQGIKLDVLGYVSRLAFTLDWNGTDISMVRNSLTAGELVKDVIDKYRSTVAEERINYGTGTVDITGSDISYTSNAKSCLETIERAREMAGATWYWYVDADNVFYFREYATTPTHLFTFGKDISSLEITRSADDIKNEFIFWNGLMADDTNFISNRYYNTTSINSYWNRFEANTDGRVTTSAGADALGDSYINAYKNPNVSMRFEVKDNNLGAGYDIESIEPGHTCKILNLDDSDVVGDNMVITSVQYTPERAIIYVSDLREMTGRSLTNLRRQLDTTVYGDRPAKLTSKAIT